MMYEYAVSPALFDTNAHLAFLYEAFGREPGRLVSEFPRKKWEQLARAVIAKFAKDDYERRQWTEALIALMKRALYPRPGSKWDDEVSWIDNAIAEHERAGRPRFRGLLSDGSLRSHPDVITVGPAIGTHKCWACPGSTYVDRNAGAMLAVLAPILDLSTMVVLIDRHFHPGDGSFVNVLRDVARRLLTNGALQRVTQIKYVTSSIKVSVGQMEAECKKLLPFLLPRGIEVKFLVVPKELLHDRFVLTNLGALQFGHGLDESTGLYESTGQVLVTRLGDAPFVRLMDQWKAWNDQTTKTKVTIFSVQGAA